MNNMLRYYLGIQPESLDDDQWAMAWESLKMIKEKENESSKNQLRNLFGGR